MYTMSRLAFCAPLPVPFWWLAQLVLSVPLEVLHVSRPLPTISTSPRTLKLCCCASCADAVPGSSSANTIAMETAAHQRHADDTIFERSEFTF